MKKHLIAAAVAGALTVPAMAQVTVYGVFDISYAVHDEDVNGRETSGLKGGNMSGNRIGFRGEEDLGGGMKASAVVETGFDPTGDSGLFEKRDGGGGHTANTLTTGTNRQSFVALSGGFGQVGIGWQYTPEYVLVGLSGIHANTEGWGGGVRNTTITGSRAQGFTYSNTLGGVKLGLLYSAKKDQTGSAVPAIDSNLISVSALYAAGPLMIGAAMGQSESAKTALTDVATPGTDTAMLAAKYNFGVAAVGFTYGTKEVKTSANAQTDTKHYEVSVGVPLGAITLIASMGNEEAKAGAAGAAKTATIDRDSWEVGATYTLSKRTNLYAFIGEADNDKAAATSAEKTRNKTIVGVRHSF